eukprot:2356737-Rhodomonas_salina.1
MTAKTQRLGGPTARYLEPPLGGVRRHESEKGGRRGERGLGERRRERRGEGRRERRRERRE